MVYTPQSGLSKVDDPTYIHPTDVFPVEPAITANSGAAEESFEAPQYVSPNHYNLADDVVADIDMPAIEATNEVYFDIPDLDVGPLIESEPYVEPYVDQNTNPDASVPVSPPRTARTPTYTRYNTISQPSPPLRRDLMNYYNANDAALTSVLTAFEPIELAKESREHAMNITVMEALRSRGVVAERVILKELSQMIKKRVWTPVRMNVLTSTEKRGIIRSQMFLKEKYLPTGVFEKLKARLVAGGNQQDKNLYDDLSSPTVSTSVVMSVFAIAAYERRNVSVVDITGAYLNADMNTGITVYMRLDKTMSSMVCKIDKEYEKYMDDKGCIVVRLDKALYGCVESAALWYENLSESLNSARFMKNKYETCVNNKKNKSGIQCTVAVYVDDLIITCVGKDMILALCDHLERMVFDLTGDGEVRMTMRGYIEDTISYAGVTGTAKSPATNGLFESRDDAIVAPEDRRVWFHSVVAKLSYLARWPKSECLTAVAYLATRVTKCTEDDLEKLRRVLRYIAGTRENGVVFRPGVLGICVRMYVDAAYGVHADGKSYTGSCIVIGDVGSVHCKSSKQSIVTKSSTEAELVALFDSTNQGLYLRNFLIDQGYLMGPAIVYQDNTSCIALVDRGRSGAEITRHIGIRYFWLRERIEKREAVVQYKGTKEMYANILTKPLQGAQFLYERKSLTGWL